MSRKNILFLAKNSPFDNANSREALDLILMLASFEVSVSICFIGDGVLQLRNTTPEVINERAFSAVLKALPHYDINQLYVLEDDIKHFGMDITQLILPVMPITKETLKQLLTTTDMVL